MLNIFPKIPLQFVDSQLSNLLVSGNVSKFGGVYAPSVTRKHQTYANLMGNHQIWSGFFANLIYNKECQPKSVFFLRKTACIYSL